MPWHANRNSSLPSAPPKIALPQGRRTITGHNIPADPANRPSNRVSTTAQSHNAPTFVLKKLEAPYIGEELGSCSFGKKYEKETGCRWHVKYMSAAERAPYKVSIDAKGLFYNADGKPLLTTISPRFGGLGMFIMDRDGNFYVSMQQDDGKFQHSTLAAGKPVAMAGELRVERGKLRYISNSSGHYKPGAIQMQQCLDRLRAKGVNLRGVEMQLYRSPVVKLKG